MARDRETAVAYHEAGHAVACLCLQHAFTSVSIVPDSGSSGRVFEEPPRGKTTRQCVENYGTMLFAGPLAEEKHTGVFNWIGAGLVEVEPEDWVLLPGRDLIKATFFAKALSSNEDKTTEEDETMAWVERFSNNAFALLDNLQVWHAVEVLAAALLEHKTLNVDRVREIVLQKCGWCGAA